MCGAQRLPGGGRLGRVRLCPRFRLTMAGWNSPCELSAKVGQRGDDRQVGRSALGLVRVIGDDDDARAGPAGQPTWRIRVLTQKGGSDAEHQIVWCEHFA
jgi:hypothetical protein